MRALFAERGIALTDVQLAKFWAFHTLFRRRNQELNLSRLHAFTTIVLKHYVDSVLAGMRVELPSPLLDLGSGAGFPGIPLKIMRPDLELVLCEPRAHRAAFLEEACRLLELDNVRILPRRLSPRVREPVAAVIARAVGPIGVLLDAARHCLEPGGLAILMKGPRVKAEIETLALPPDYELLRVESYAIPKSPHERSLAVFRRTGASGGPVVIASARNERLKQLRRLLSARGIAKEGLALFSGRKIVPEVIRAHAPRIALCIVRGFGPLPPGLPAGVPALAVIPELFDELDPAGTGGPLLAVRVPPLPPWTPAARDGPSLLLGFQDPVNIGAALRLGAAFGAAEAVILREGASPYLPRSIRAAGPAVLTLPLAAGPPMGRLATAPLPLIVLSPRGTPLPEFRFPRSCAILAGLEGPGLPPGLTASATLAIPMHGAVESLNAATALAIALYGYRLQHPLR
jgi:16S rRNA (guanine527-N7)-methyltransferase